jgi:hypothetical protein
MSNLSHKILSKIKNNYDTNYIKSIEIPPTIKEPNHGYFYILYNISYSAFHYENPFKIGKTNQPLSRLTNHSCSQILNCNYVYISKPCIDYNCGDRLLKQHLRKYKINRELYDIKLEDAIEIINRIINNVNYPLDFRTNNDSSRIDQLLNDINKSADG